MDLFNFMRKSPAANKQGQHQKTLLPRPAQPAPIPTGGDTGTVIKDAAQGTQALEALLIETLEKYPIHYERAQKSLLQNVGSQGCWLCCGGKETGLDESGMEVTFDFRKPQPDWRRILIGVIMCNGQVVRITMRELKSGEHSGVAGFDPPSQGNVPI